MVVIQIFNIRADSNTEVSSSATSQRECDSCLNLRFEHLFMPIVFRALQDLLNGDDRPNLFRNIDRAKTSSSL